MTGAGRSHSATDPDAEAVRQWLADDAARVWHPFTAMQQWGTCQDQPGRLIVAADGFELIDQAGRRFIDGFGSLWCNLHGHRVPQIDAAIRDQIQRVAHTTLLGHASPPSIDLARRLVQIAPAGLEHVFYSDSGATAVEGALKMAFQYWAHRGQRRRRKFLSLRYGYHGDTVGAISVGGIDLFHGMFGPLMFSGTVVESPNGWVHPSGPPAAQEVLAEIDTAISSAPQEYCAVILEPMIQGAGGMLTHPEGFLAGVRELTARHDVLLIADEVATGFCRTGKLFACDHEDVRPDILCLGKGLTGGYLPVAATLATDEVFDAFGDPGGTFYHGHTFTGNALGCAAAVASIDLIESSGLVGSLPAKARQISEGLAGLLSHPNVAEIRQCGMMVGIQLVSDKATRGGFDPQRRVGADVCNHARNHGIITRPLGDAITLVPAPAMDAATLQRLLDGTVATLVEYFDEHRA